MWSIGCSLLALGLLGGSPPPAQAVSPGPRLLYARPAKAPQLEVRAPFHAPPLLISGTDAYRNGEYLYQDYLLDDHGADTAPGLGSSATWASMPLFSPAAGDVMYPSERRFSGQDADLAELRIRPTRSAILYRLTYGAPSTPGTVVAGIGIRTGGPGTGGTPVAWPFDAGLSSPGLRFFITAWGTGGAVAHLPDARTTRLPAGAVRFDPRRAQMTIRVPRAMIDPGTARWRFVAGTGLWDGRRWMQVVPGTTPQPSRPVSGSPLAGAPAVFNLAFRFHEPVAMSQAAGGGPSTTAPGIGNWFEDAQARNLAARTTGADFADVDFGALARRANRFVHAPGRVQARIYGSRLPIGAGVDHAAFPEFGGALQPYLVRVPPGYSGRAAPLLFSLHPSNSGYTVYNVSIPNWGRELGDQRGSIVVTPLSRGLNGPYPVSGAFTGAAEADFFEVWADLRRHFTIDRSRVTLSGYSLGGYAAYALAETWPDLFANVYSVVGAPPANAMNTELLGNVRWEPVLAWNQADDSEVPYTDASAAERTLTALGLRHEAWTFPAGGHLAPALRDDWRSAVARIDAARLVRNPPRVALGIYPALDDRRFGLVHDHAYWLSGLRVAAGRARGDLDAHSLAFGVADAPASSYSSTGSSGGSAAIIHGVRWGPVPHAGRRDALTLTLHGIDRVRIDGGRARLRGRRGLSLSILSDVRALVRLDLPICRRPRVRRSGALRRVRVLRRGFAFLAGPGRATVKIVRCGR